MKITVIFMGATMPEESKKYGLTVCSAGWSPTLQQFIRIYPVPIENYREGFARRWDEYEMDVERNPHDTRRESWKIVWRITPKRIKSHDKHEILEGLRKYSASSVEGLNDSRMSLALLFIPPGLTKIEGRGQEVSQEGQPEIFPRENPLLRKDFHELPYITFLDNRGWHTIPLLDRGSYELLTKTKPGGGFYSVADLKGALKIGEAQFGHFLFIGNMNAYRRNWLVISCLPFKESVKDQNQMKLTFM